MIPKGKAVTLWQKDALGSRIRKTEKLGKCCVWGGHRCRIFTIFTLHHRERMLYFSSSYRSIRKPVPVCTVRHFRLPKSIRLALLGGSGMLKKGIARLTRTRASALAGGAAV